MALRTSLYCAVFVSATLLSSLGLAARPGANKDKDNAKPATPEAAARAKLSEKGIKATHSGISLVDEKQLDKAFGVATKLKRKLVDAAKQQRQAELAIEDVQANIQQLLVANAEMNSQLAGLTSNPVEHNRLVAAANANISEIKLLEQAEEQSKKELDATRKKSNAAQDGYVQEIAEIRSLVDRLSERYTALKSDADAQRALAEWNAAANQAFEIKPSGYFLRSVKTLESLEKAVDTDKIPLRHEHNSYYASVVVNGKQPPQDMIVDSGAGCVVLPYTVAIECGVKPEESTATGFAILADGSKVKGKYVQLESVRVGKFKVDNVRCMVLLPEARNATALLGTSYLSKFNFSINGTELVLSQISDDHPQAKPKKSRTTKNPPKLGNRRSSSELGR
jgi:clan AA aspartic protease (TIGR02281 family)